MFATSTITLRLSIKQTKCYKKLFTNLLKENLMKNLSTLIGIMTMVFFSACTSLEKMVETGHYDQAIVKVAKKISGKKNKKTKDIKILESAFAKIIEEDLTRAANLKESGRASAWDEVFNAYVSIEERQELVRPFLPLVSKDGYKANFNFANVQTLKNEAADNAIVYHYTRRNVYLIYRKTTLISVQQGEHMMNWNI